MPNKINWSKMIEDLEEKLGEVKTDTRKEGLYVDLSLGKNPPRIYAKIPKPNSLIYIDDIAGNEYKEGVLEFRETTTAIANILRQNGLKQYPLRDPSHFGDDMFTTVYGLDHSHYKMVDTKKE